MAAQTLDNTAYMKLLKTIRSDAREKGGSIEYSELKKYFQDVALTAQQAENLWTFLDSNCIMILHIDEYDSLFAQVPETVRDDEMSEGTEGSASFAGAVSAASGDTSSDDESSDGQIWRHGSSRQDVSNVNLHSTAIGLELINRAAKKKGLTIPEDQVDILKMDAARKIAGKLRPNEMHALYLYWRLDGNKLTIPQMAGHADVPAQLFPEIEARAFTCVPKLPGEKKGFFASLFKR